MRQQNEDWLFPLRSNNPLQPLPYEYIEGRDCRDAFIQLSNRLSGFGVAESECGFME